jgi:hypothetical protein
VTGDAWPTLQIEAFSRELRRLGVVRQRTLAAFWRPELDFK